MQSNPWKLLWNSSTDCTEAMNVPGGVLVRTIGQSNENAISESTVFVLSARLHADTDKPDNWYLRAGVPDKEDLPT